MRLHVKHDGMSSLNFVCSTRIKRVAWLDVIVSLKDRALQSALTLLRLPPLRYVSNTVIDTIVSFRHVASVPEHECDADGQRHVFLRWSTGATTRSIVITVPDVDVCGPTPICLAWP